MDSLKNGMGYHRPIPLQERPYSEIRGPSRLEDQMDNRACFFPLSQLRHLDVVQKSPEKLTLPLENFNLAMGETEKSGKETKTIISNNMLGGINELRARICHDGKLTGMRTTGGPTSLLGGCKKYDETASSHSRLTSKSNYS